MESAPVCANRSARSMQAYVARAVRAAVPNGTALFVAVTTLSTMGTCAPDVRFAVAGCTVQVLSDAASAQVSATAPAKESKKSATSW